MNLRTFLNQCFAPAVLSLRLSFVVKNRRSYGIANYAKLSFLAGTRNLMIMVCSICFCFIAGLVLFLRQDPWSWPGMTALLALYIFVGVYCFFDRRT